MKAVTVKEAGSADQLQITDQPVPEPGKGELLIKVEAAAINRTDILAREGKAGYMKNPILGIEVAGTVVESSSPSWSEGDRIMGLVEGGGYAEYAVMPADRGMPIPSSLSFEEAAAVPEVFLTAFQTLYWIGKLQKEETVLIHAGASGVGTAAIQLAHKLSRARTIVTAGSEKKLNVCRELGADVGINYKTDAFEKEVLKQTNDTGADLILDFIGASYWEKNLMSVRTDGRWVLIGILGGAEVEKINLMDILLKRVQITGTLLTPRSSEYKAELTADFVKHTMHLFQRGDLAPVVDEVFSLEDVPEAHRKMEANKNIGKIVLRIH
ncbi:putative PIG3 family NAD(P)H quinone oxidoreductase [Sinobaca qinghaiensis]|uniref:Putative PIG3 family NAD(P)H quinone oxidoreductase n=1 Tax=Sinobaca qinghaiensis TaxID=342944 RepID=A0A419V5R8_9BACL|nr:NAD(P)H-quinone oxidoreductase [Sinobaca qinghaiensis]RKD75181.1 putative PIG3 family NAD(P)H quinone oxidoreductase [Sinobaca qinghaiensis]